MYGPTQYLQYARRHYGSVPFDLAVSGIASVTREELGSAPSSDDPAAWRALPRAIARYNGVPDGEAMVALGTTQAMWLAYASVLSPGDDVLIEEPAYEPVYRIAESLGANVVRYARPADRGYRIDPARIEAAMTPKTRIVALTSLHNPTGVRTSDDDLKAVAAIAARNGAYLLVGEVYAPFDALVDSDGIWGKSARNLAPNVLAAGSLTKCFGLGNERIGWLLAPPDVLERADHAMVSTCGHLPLLHASTALHAFERLPALAARTRKHLEGKRERVEAWLAQRSDLTWSAPASGLFGFARLTDPGAAKNLRARIEQGFRDHGVLVAAGEFFEMPDGFRLAWSLDAAKLDEALSRLDKVIREGR